MNIKNNKMRLSIIASGVVALLGLGFGAYTVSNSKTQKITGAPSINVTATSTGAAIPGNSDSINYNKQLEEKNKLDAQAAIESQVSFEPKLTNAEVLNNISPIDSLDKIDVNVQTAEAKPIEIKIEPVVFNQTPVEETKPVVVNIEPVQPVQITPAPAPQPEIIKPKYGPETYALIGILAPAYNYKGSAIEVDHTGAPKPETKTNSNIQTASYNGNSTYGATTTSYESGQGTRILEAGETLPAIIETSIKSDEPSPVLARVIGGKYKGSKAICGLQSNKETVVVECKTLNIPGTAKSLSVSLIAVAPETNRTALATDVDHHYFEKYVVGLGATFLKGAADALLRQNTVTTTSVLGTVTQSTGELSGKDISRSGIGEMGRDIAQEVKSNSANLKPTVYVEAGTAIGLMSLDDVFAK